MIYLYILIGMYVLVCATWTFYLAVMHLKHNQDKLTTGAKLIAYPVLFTAYVCDVAMNWIVGSVLFVEYPHEYLFTDRVERHLGDIGGRGDMARWFCRNLLDPFDPSGRHCR